MNVTTLLQTGASGPSSRTRRWWRPWSGCPASPRTGTGAGGWSRRTLRSTTFTSRSSTMTDPRAVEEFSGETQFARLKVVVLTWQEQCVCLVNTGPPDHPPVGEGRDQQGDDGPRPRDRGVSPGQCQEEGDERASRYQQLTNKKPIDDAYFYKQEKKEIFLTRSV